MSRFNVWPWVRPFLILILAISVPWVIYWLGFVQSSVLAARQQAYETLAAVASDFSDRLIAHDKIADTTAKPFEMLSRSEDATREPENGGSEKASARSGDKGKTSDDGRSELEAYLRSVLKARQIAPMSPGEHRLQLGDGSEGLYVYVSAPDTFCEGSGPCSIRATVPLEHLIPWNVVETEFDGLLVLSENRRLLAQDRRLPAQPLGGPVALTLGADSRADMYFRGETDRQQSKAGEGVARRLFDFNHDALLQVAGVDYVAFLQQVSVPRTAVDASLGRSQATAPINVVLCGLIARERLRREAIALSPQTLILVGSLIAFGVFAIPFLKLRFIGERERMHHRDVWLLGISVICATALFVLIILNLSAIDTLRTRFDVGLIGMAKSLHEHLIDERDATIEELNLSAPALLKVASKPLDECSRTQPNGRSRRGGSILSAEKLLAYPDIEALAVTDRCGNQLLKWMARSIPTPYINHSPEPFFTPALTLDPERPYAFSTTLAPTSGLLLSVFAVPVSADDYGPTVPLRHRTGVLLIAHEMRSVNSPVIAPPYQFVLVDRGGAVTYHHTHSSFRGERFFEAIPGGAALKRAARDRPGSPTDVETYDYRGAVRRMTAIDIPDLNLTLVSYYDQAVPGALSGRVFATAAVFSGATALAVLLSAALSIGLFGTNALNWMWPSASRIRYYVLGTIVCLLIMLLLLVARTTLPPRLLPWLFIGGAFATVIGLGSGLLTRWARWAFSKLGPPTKHTRRSLRAISVWFTSFATIAILTFVAWPTKLVFHDAFDLQSAAYEKTVRDQWAAARDDWDARSRQELVDFGPDLSPMNCASKPDDLRCAEPDRIYASNANYTTLLQNREQFGIYDSCVNLTTAENPCSGHATCSAETAAHGCEHRIPYSFTAATASWLAHLPGNQSDLVTTTTLSVLASSQDEAENPQWRHDLNLSLWGLGSLALLLATVWALTRSVATHVLGIGLMDDTVLDESTDVQPANGSKWLLLRPSRRTVETIGGRNLDLRDLRDPGQLPQFVSPASDCTLLLEHLEYRLNDPQWRSALLTLITTRHAGCIAATTDVDPLHYLTQRVRAQADHLKWLDPEEKEKRAQVEKAHSELRDELACWAVAMRQVRKIRERQPEFAMPTPPPSGCLHHDWIVRECAPVQALHEIGLRLLGRTDLDGYSEDDLVSFVRDAAEPWYRSVWELCSREERLVLIQLAQAGLVNPKQMDVVRRLARRGLLRVDPRFRLMNRSFEDFVRSVEPAERVAEWERTGSTLAWTQLATPLYALGAMAITVLLFAEQGLLTSILAAATGSAATIGSLRSLYATVTKTSPSETKLA